jgi:hypothetical protein
MLKKIETEAERIVKDTIQLTTPVCNDADKLFSAICHLIEINRNGIEETVNFVEEIKKCCTCIEGVCYFIGLNSRLPSNMTKKRCAHFVARVDKYLYQYGVKPCSIETKEALFRALGLYDMYLESPVMFGMSGEK